MTVNGLRFSVGYRLPDERDSTVAWVTDYLDSISEVYFALPGHPSGRSPVGLLEGWSGDEANRVLFGELAELVGLGVRSVLLLNGSCYGPDGASQSLCDEAVSAVERCVDGVGLHAVTTASPFVAQRLQERGLPVAIRASVNMRLGSIAALEHVSDRFDEYYVKRELNRDVAALGELHEWCEQRGKSLHMLLNSGCLRDCAFQTFHDNLVSHEAEIDPCRSFPERFPAPCWEYLSRRGNWEALLHNTWIRPEDVTRVAPWVDGLKLATRLHSNPRRVIGAYSRGRHRGNLLDLMEPGYGELLRGYMVDNSLFPDDWFERTSSCGAVCHRCSYCSEVFERVLVPTGEPVSPAPLFP